MGSTYVNRQKYEGGRAHGVFSFSSEAVTQNQHIYHAEGQFSFSGTAQSETSVAFDANGQFSFSGSANPQIDTNPDIYLTAEGQFSFTGEASVTVQIITSAQGLFSFSGEANIHLVQPDESFFSVIIEVVPEDYSAIKPPGSSPLPGGAMSNGFIKESEGKFEVDGLEIPIIEWEYNEDSDLGGSSLTLKLARIEDKDSFTNDSVINFSIGKRLTATTWDTASLIKVFENGDLQSTSYNISWSGDGPGDTVTITAISKMGLNLLKSPATDVVIFDPGKEELTQDDFEPIYDTAGNAYNTELKGIYGLGLYDLFNEVLVTRCGFSSYKTNIPDFPLRRVDCTIGASYLASIKGYFGMFDPVLFVEGDEIWIVDTTSLLPAGFPGALDLKTNRYISMGETKARARIDALVLIYSETKKNYDYTTERAETESTSSGHLDSYLSTLVEKKYTQYRRFAHPSVVLKEELWYSSRTVSSGSGVIEKTIDTFLFDAMGRTYQRDRVTTELLPDLNSGGSFVLMQSSSESESFAYSPHPYKKRSYYLQKRELIESGIVVVDNENPQLGTPYSRDFKQAYRSGNVRTGMQIVNGPLRTTTETVTPHKDGTLSVSIQNVDHVANVSTVNIEENRVGDISISTLSQFQNRMIVFAQENVLRTTTGNIESLNIGELPVSLGIALANRILVARQTKGGKLTVPIIAYDRRYRRGMTVCIKDRDNLPVGNFIIMGRTARGDRNMTEMTITGKEI